MTQTVAETISYYVEYYINILIYSKEIITIRGNQYLLCLRSEKRIALLLLDDATDLCKMQVHKLIYERWFREKQNWWIRRVTLISFTSTEISVSKPRRTCKEASNSSVIPIFALIWFNKVNSASTDIPYIRSRVTNKVSLQTYQPPRRLRNEKEAWYQY